MNAQPSPLTIHPHKTALLAEIRTLELQITQLEEEKAGCQCQIDHYYRLFRQHLGGLLTRTVELQMRLAIRRATQTGRRSDAEEAENWRERFEHTNQAVREAIAHQPVVLDETAERELRRLYRQAVMLAHPDRHAHNSDRMAQATAYMVQLNEAYKHRDLATVRQLLQNLTDGLLNTAHPDSTRDLDELRHWHQRLVDRKTGLQTSVNRLKADQAYRLMTTGADLMAHFAKLQQEMLQQIDYLRGQLQAA